MVALYDIGIFCLRAAICIASWFNPKARAFRHGRVEQSQRLRKLFSTASIKNIVWFHCASLGEFEQGRPVIDAMKAWRPDLRVLLTFFSPSGYEVQKNYKYADYVFYLPWDTRQNAQWFVENVRPALVVFVKYEFWHHYASTLKKRNIPLVSISSIFRPNQVFFRPHGSFFRSILKNFHFFFVQTQQSVDLLHGIGITSVAIAGDTRFDRVHQIALQEVENPVVQQFKSEKKLMVIGSAWKEDMTVLYPFINLNPYNLKFVIAPHEIKEAFLAEIENSIDLKTIRYSAIGKPASTEGSVLLIDNIGLLSQLYRYGEVAFVGGAYGAGLHNILEAACYGIPVFFGNKSFKEHKEAVDLIAQGGAFAVGDFNDLSLKYAALIGNDRSYQQACSVTRQYIKENLGATDKIVNYSKTILG